jgi:hypothetical protein
VPLVVGRFSFDLSSTLYGPNFGLFLHVPKSLYSDGTHSCDSSSYWGVQSNHAIFGQFRMGIISKTSVICHLILVNLPFSIFWYRFPLIFRHCDFCNTVLQSGELFSSFS